MTRLDAAWCVGIGLACLVAGASTAGHVQVHLTRSEPLQPVVRARAGYTGSESCRACHPDAYASWHASYHRTMTQAATPEAVRGRFEDGPLDADGHAVARDGAAFYVQQPGERERRRVVMTTGSHHMQVYWTAETDGSLTAFAYAFLLPEQRWVPIEHTLLRPAAPATRYTWNRVCIKCHAVAGTPGWDDTREHADTRVAELGIACEACHGPAEAHARRMRSPWQRFTAGREARGDVLDPGAMAGARASEICAQCHAITVFHDDAAWVRGEQGGSARDPLDRTLALVRHPARDPEATLVDAITEEDPNYFAARFWSDGLVRVSGREYNGIVESACARDPAFGCLSCHSMHASEPDDQLRRDRDPDDACRGCHGAIAADVTAHSHHTPASEGSRCVNCHQPHTTYGLLGAMRSHTIDRPSVRASLDTGRPNACNLCHLDRSLAWTAERLLAWYGQPVPEDLPARAAEALHGILAGDAGERAIVAWHFAWPPARAASGVRSDRPWTASWLAELLGDDIHAVRWVAARALRRTPGFEALPLDGLDGEGVPRAYAWVRERWRGDGAPEPPAHAWPRTRGDLATFMAGLVEQRDLRPVELAE